MGKYSNFIDTISLNGGFNALDTADGGLEIYISFRTLLQFTSEYLNLYSNGLEIIKIDYESDKPMFMYSTTVSTNLKKCYIFNGYLETAGGTLPLKVANYFKDVQVFRDSKFMDLRAKLKEDVDPSFFNESSNFMYPSIGNINNINLNIVYLSELLTKHSDNESGKVSIREFLQAVCNGVNKALGSINDLQVVADVDGGQDTLTIVDFQTKRIKGLATLFSKAEKTTIKAQGLGSMLTSISAQSSITPEIASMISIGAQKDGSALGEDATSFSKLSAGLIDRMYPVKEITNQTTDFQKKKAEQVQEKFESNLKAYSLLIENQLSDSEGTITYETTQNINIENITADLYKFALSKFTETNQTTTAFIPIKLDITIYGISGIKIFQAFKLTKDVLPLSYKEEYEFIIMGISHTVNNSRWETTISAILTLADKEVKEKEGFAIKLPKERISFISSSPTNGTSGDLNTSWGKKATEQLLISTGTAGQGALTTVTNGEVPDEYMRELNSAKFPYSKWVGTISSDNGRVRLLKPIMDNLEKMLDAYQKDSTVNTLPLYIISAFRTFEDQAAVRKVWESKGKPKNAATPGQSKHGFGRAIDFGYTKINSIKATKTDEGSAQYEWIKANAEKYGFKRLPFAGKGEDWEAWHWQDTQTKEI